MPESAYTFGYNSTTKRVIKIVTTPYESAMIDLYKTVKIKTIGRRVRVPKCFKYSYFFSKTKKEAKRGETRACAFAVHEGRKEDNSGQFSFPFSFSCHSCFHVIHVVRIMCSKWRQI
jgi:hypothetical protein